MQIQWKRFRIIADLSVGVLASVVFFLTFGLLMYSVDPQIFHVVSRLTTLVKVTFGHEVAAWFLQSISSVVHILVIVFFILLLKFYYRERHRLMLFSVFIMLPALLIESLGVLLHSFARPGGQWAYLALLEPVIGLAAVWCTMHDKTDDKNGIDCS